MPRTKKHTYSDKKITKRVLRVSTMPTPRPGSHTVLRLKEWIKKGMSSESPVGKALPNFFLITKYLFKSFIMRGKFLIKYFIYY